MLCPAVLLHEEPTLADGVPPSRQGRARQARTQPVRFCFDKSYRGIHLLPDGTILANTYGKLLNNNRKYSVYSVRLKIAEIVIGEIGVVSDS